MVNYTFEIAVNILEMFIVLRFLSLYFGFKYNGISRYLSFGCAWIISTIILCVVNYTFQYEGIIGLLFAGIYFLYGLLFLKGSAAMKLFISGFIICFIYLISFCTGLVINILGRYNLGDLFSDMGIGRFLWIMITKIILLAVTQILIKFKFDSYIKLNDIWLIIIVPVIALSTINILMYTCIDYPNLQFPMLLASVSIIMSSILTYYIYVKISKNSKTRAEYEILQKSYEMDKRNAQNVKELYDSACGLRHDLKLHLETINSLMHDNIGDAEQYIRSLLKNQAEPILSFIKTNNKSFDAIVNTKLSICSKLNIKTELRIMNDSLNGLTNDEIGILFGNLFDNAIEASKDTDERTIILEVQKQGEYISIFMSNSINRSVLCNNKNLNTTKKDGQLHGYGIKNIRRIVEKKEGLIEFFEDNGMFCCDILL